ncbi:MAG: tRNA pseudouridine(38-40) synthase TruA [Mycoplasmatota bacterium]
MRYLMTVSYDGSKFYGYQKQLELKTVQGELEQVISKIAKEDVFVSSSGRTDRGVHALNQMIHFDLPKEIKKTKLQKAINSLVDKSIYIKNIEEVEDDFHARFNVLKKEYEYIINIGEYEPLRKEYEYQYNQPLNIKQMKKALKYFKGTHNFKSFAKTNDKITNYIRTIYGVKLKEENGKIIINFIGDGFFRYQVRNMVGILIEIGQGKKQPKSIKEIILKENRTYAGITAKPQGLYLKEVFY